MEKVGDIAKAAADKASEAVHRFTDKNNKDSDKPRSSHHVGDGAIFGIYAATPQVDSLRWSDLRSRCYLRTLSPIRNDLAALAEARAVPAGSTAATR